VKKCLKIPKGLPEVVNQRTCVFIGKRTLNKDYISTQIYRNEILNSKQKKK
jgi:hypothetical protein